MDFGGDWTVKKLDVLKRYLDSYTTALKGQHFRLVYIDAFAGDGTVKFETPDSEFRSVVDGSARLALEVKDKQFDRLVFVEQDGERCEELRKLQDHYSNRRVDIVQADANTFLQRLDLNRFAWRGVLFVDPFATQVEWATVQTIASFEALDMWLLFPLSAIARMLPRSRSPGDIDSAWASRLTRIYGDESWRGLYQESRQQLLFGTPQEERPPGVDGLLEIYKRNLEHAFGARLLEKSVTLKTANNSPLFELIFCVGSPSGIGPAKNIASHILKHI